MIKNIKTKKLGFTMIEMLLSISIITIILGISTPVYQSLQGKNDLSIAATTIAQALHRAQTLAQSGDGDALWGVKMESGAVTVFQGASYASRDTNFDEVYGNSAGISVSGITEIIFDKLTGEPSPTGTINLALNNYETKNITINEKGMVNY